MRGPVGDVGTAVVTGATGFTGRYIARRLLDRGAEVRTLTDHPDREAPIGDRLGFHPYSFEEPAAMARFMSGAEVFFNTYWVRFSRGETTFRRAVDRSGLLFRAARAAAVERIVHVSIANPSEGSPLPYYRGKALVEADLRGLGVSHAILRPTLVFGSEDILLNNIAWLLRRFPVFLVPGDGTYPVRPVHVDDVAAAALGAAVERESRIENVAGPEALTFRELLEAVAGALDTGVRLWRVPPALAYAATRILGWILDDVVLTRHELEGLRAGLLTVDEARPGGVRFTEWIRAHAGELGRSWHSELDRHFR